VMRIVTSVMPFLILNFSNISLRTPHFTHYTNFKYFSRIKLYVYLYTTRLCYNIMLSVESFRHKSARIIYYKLIFYITISNKGRIE